jgi:hypothetical protein
MKSILEVVRTKSFIKETLYNHKSHRICPISPSLIDKNLPKLLGRMS